GGMTTTAGACCATAGTLSEARTAVAAAISLAHGGMTVSPVLSVLDWILRELRPVDHAEGSRNHWQTFPIFATIDTKSGRDGSCRYVCGSSLWWDLRCRSAWPAAAHWSAGTRPTPCRPSCRPHWMSVRERYGTVVMRNG